MTAAYNYGMGDGPAPRELELSRLCEKYGAQALIDGPLTVSLARRMTAVDNIVAWTAAWVEGGAEWAQEHPTEMETITEIARNA
jgi:hypothetical protein